MCEALRRSRFAALPAITALILVMAVLSLAGCGTGTGEHHAPDSARPGRRPSAAHRLAWDRHPDSIAALGDSITRAFDACSLVSDCPDASWATGTRAAVDSLAARLLPPSDDHVWNFARSGTRMSELPDQMRRAERERPRLVTVLMGANDACTDSVTGMTPVAEFRAQFTAAMDSLHHTLPTTEVYVSSIPDLLHLWTVGRQNALARQIWGLGLCRSMLGDAASMTPASRARRDAVRTREVAFNAVLDEVCARHPLCRYDDGAVFDHAFTADELSAWDWFHPSVLGQSQLARIAYATITR